MATNFPTSLDALNNPTSSNTLASPDHAGQHADANDAIEALQAKVGINGSSVPTSIDYLLSILMPIGSVLPYAGSTAPTNFLLCFGQAVSRSTYASLFAVIGITYGVGNGSTTFNLPDLRGRTIIGKDDMGGTAASRVTTAISSIDGASLGASGGSESLHGHSHANTITNNAVTSGAGSAHSHANTAAFTGTAASHNHTQDAHGHNISDPTHNHAQNNVGVRDTDDAGTNGFVRATAVVDATAGLRGNVASATGVTVVSNTATNQATSITPAGTVAMTNANESAHTHSVTSNATISNATSGAGSSQNVQPSLILNYIIKV